MTVEGVCDPAFTAVRELLDSQLAVGEQLGAAIAVRIGGRTVLDLWGGHRDPARQRPWRQDTLVNIWSTSKGPVALAAHMLADRGLLDLDAAVCRYWPEFAAAGKETVLVRHLLSHRAGLASFREPTKAADLCDWRLITERLAATEPWWAPGTVSGYHALTFGYLVGEVIHRVTGRTVGDFVRTEFAGVDFQIGLAPADRDRAATVIQPPPDLAAMRAMFAQLNPIALGVLTNPVVGPDDANSDAWRAAEIPAANGYGTARAVAELYDAFRGGPLLSRRQADLVAEGQGSCVDLVTGIGVGGAETELGLGLWLSGPDGHYGPNPAALGHDGFGGSFGLVDRQAEMSIGYVMNLMGQQIADDPRKMALIDAVYSCLCSSATPATASAAPDVS